MKYYWCAGCQFNLNANLKQKNKHIDSLFKDIGSLVFQVIQPSCLNGRNEHPEETQGEMTRTCTLHTETQSKLNVFITTYDTHSQKCRDSS